MDINDDDVFRMRVEDILRKSMSDEYTNDVLDVIIDYVREDVKECADEDFNDDDLKLAIGRALVVNLGRLPF